MIKYTIVRFGVAVIMFFSVSVVSAQDFAPDWYVLGKGAEVAVIKPGVNDLTYYIAATGNKPIDKAAVDAMVERINFYPGSVVLVHAKVGDNYIATDMEGRNLVIRGAIIKAMHTDKSGVAYMKNNFTPPSGINLKAGMYVWMKTKKDKVAIIECDGGKEEEVDIAKLYFINELSVDMANTTHYKPVKD